MTKIMYEYHLKFKLATGETVIWVSEDTPYLFTEFDEAFNFINLDDYGDTLIDDEIVAVDGFWVREV